MKLQSLDVTARGQSRRITFSRAVTILSAPNGSGKSTALACLEFALKGTVTVDGKPRKQEGAIFAHLSANGEPVAVNAAFDRVTIARGLTGTDTGAKQALHFSGCAMGTKVDVAQGAIIATLGDLARVDVADLLSKGPTDRRAAVLGLCRQFARPWTLTELREAWEAAAQQGAGYEADGPRFSFTPLPGVGLLEALEGDAAAAKQAVLDANARVKTLQQAIDRMAEHAAGASEPGDADAMAARIRDLGAEIERLSGEVASIDAANQSAETIARRLDELAQLPPAERAQADLGKAREAYAGLLAEKAVLSPPRAPVEPAEIADLRRQVEEQQAVIAKAVAESDGATDRIVDLQAVLKKMAEDKHGADCPTCVRPMDDSAVAALERAVEALRAVSIAATSRGDAATDVRDCLLADLNAARSDHAKAVEAYNKARSEHASSAARLDASVMEKKRAVTEAETILTRSQAAGAERTELHDRRAKLATGDTDMLRNQIAGATKERAELTERRDRVVQDAARQQAYREQIANRDEARESIPKLKAAAEAWRDLVNQVAESAIEPFLNACNAALPSGWTMGFDVDGGDFTVRRGDLAIPFSALSGGEKVMAVAAMAVALAKCAGNPWRAVILDACEQIMGADWQDPAYPDGLFAAFVRRLASAAEAGLIDQVIMATSRRLTGREGAAVRGVAQVVEMGVPEPSPDDSLPWSAPEPVLDNVDVEATMAEFGRPIEGEKPRAKAIREALRGTSAEAHRFMYERLVGTQTASTVATVRRVVNERLQEFPGTLAEVMVVIEKAKAAHPMKMRTAGEEAVA